MLEMAKGNGNFRKQRPKKKQPNLCDASVLTWFNKNTFHHSEFEDIDKLVELKKQQNVKISVGIPTLNEEENVANVVTTIKDSLYAKKHLVDERHYTTMT